MQTRLTTPGLIVTAIIALVVASLAVMRIVSSPEPAVVAIPKAAPAGPRTALGNFNPAMVYAARRDGVVSITSLYADQDIKGSGFVVDAEGHILTASHVVYDYFNGDAASEEIYVEFSSHDRVPATLVGLDQFSDLAVLKVDPSQLEAKLKPVPWGNSDRVTVGEPVAAIGDPFGNQGSLTDGIVSATNRVAASQINRNSNIADMIQVTAEINKGNSGGPLFNGRGEVIAINQQIRTGSGQSAGVALGVPSNLARRTVEQIIDTGSAHYAWLGITTETVSPQLAKAAQLPVTHGALVAAVAGPAAEAGLSANGQEIAHQGATVRLGDLIVSIAGSPVTTREDVNRIASRVEVGQSVEVRFYRDGELRKLDLVAAERELTTS